MRFERPSVLARREDLDEIRIRIVEYLKQREGEQTGLSHAVSSLGARRADKAVAYGGLALAAVGAMGLLAGGPVTWLTAAAGAGTIGGSGFAVFGAKRMWDHVNELKRLRKRQRWLAHEISCFEKALERIAEAIELRKIKKPAFI